MIHSNRPVFVFDGNCVLCSTGVAFVMRHDRHAKVRFLSAQSPLGQRIYRHLGKPIDESYLFIDAAGVHMRTDGWFRVAETLGGGWRVWTLFRIVPRALRDRAYDLLARNRYRWFGTTRQCALLTPDQRKRLVTDDAAISAQIR